MLKNYFTIVIRFMANQKGFSFINIAGLTISIVCNLLIILYIVHELDYDTFHPDADRIYRVSFQGKIQGKKIESAYTGIPLARTLQHHSSSVAATCRLASWPTFPMRFEDRSFTEPYLLLADSNFFSFFHFTLVEGRSDTVLTGDHKIVITESAARRYFDYKGPGDKTPLGKTLTLAQGYAARVTGIAADPPLNGHFHFSCILSLASWDEARETSWTSGRVITYLKRKPDGTVGAIAEDLKRFYRQYVNPELEALRKIDLSYAKRRGTELHFRLQPLLNIHLHSHLTDEIERNGDIEHLYLFGSIAVFITLLACINFMNLSTARSASRAKEVGVRKSVGAPNLTLIRQFLTESYFYVGVAVVIALFFLMVLIGPFNMLTEKQLDSGMLLSPLFLLGTAAFVFLTGLLAGSYPAFYLTQFSPVEVLQGRIRTRLRSSYGIRNALVVFQFLISTGLIIATLTVYLQLQYLQKTALGFDKHNIINLLHTANLKQNAVAFKAALLQHPDIVQASYCNRLPPNLDWQYVFRPTGSEEDFLLNVYEMDYDHLKTMQYAMVKGRFFSPDFASDSVAVILNEAAARKMNLTDLAGKKLFTDYGDEKGTEREVIGIMQDFNFQSLRDPIQPMAIVLGREPNWEMAIRLRGQDHRSALNTVRMLWKRYADHAPFEYTFLDKNFEEKLKTEKRIGLLFLLFTLLAILIACLGLFGLASFTAEQRTKEIGIRKVLGASINDILVMLNKDFLRLVLIANLLAWPVTAWLMWQWLEQFAYHTGLRWWIFAVAGVLTFVISLLSVSTQAVRAASGNPVNSLRNE